MTFDTFRTRLFATTIICSAIGSAAFAQTATPAPAPQAAAEEEMIVVTGSLIRNPNLVSAAPVTVVGEDELQLRNTSVAEDILRELPGVVPSIGSAVNNGNGGASFVNLRGLGSNRNIVLIDGVRLVPAELNGRFDLNNIPVALLQRVDVLTGGASTTYGADAVSGVVNFITKQDFTGAQIEASMGLTERGDGNRFRIDATIGASTDDGRGNVVLSVGYQQTDPIYQGSREVSLSQYDSFTGNTAGSGTSVPSRFTNTNPTAGNLIANTTAAPETCNPTLAGGTIVGLPACVNPQAGARQITDDGLAFRPTAAFTPFNFNPLNIFQTPFERYNIFAQGRYEVMDGLEVYARGLYSKNNVRTIIAPSGAFALSVQVPLGNPFLTDAQRNAFCNVDINPSTTFTPRFTPAECTAAATARRMIPGPGGTMIANPAYREVTTTLSRRAVEAGPRVSDFNTQIFDYRMGLRGGITDTIDWDVSGSYGESENTQTQQGYTLNSRTRQALLAERDASGNPVCQNPASGCVPVDYFGVAGDASPAAINFLVGNSQVLTKSTLGQARGTISGEAPFTVPFADRAVSFAIGGEYREYSASQVSDLLSQSGDLGGAGGAAPNINGGYDVKEAFGEVNIPLVAGKPFFHEFSIGGGVRWSNYTINAPGTPKFDTLTWKAEGVWEPIEGYRLRGNYAKASRAPNIAELFNPQNTVLTNLSDDPCANLNDAGGAIPGRPVPSGVLRDVCIAQGANPAVIGSISVPTAGQSNTTTGGNPNLGPEDSKSWTVGAVVTPDWLRGFSASVDYYNIKITGAITTPTPGDAINACFGAGNLSVSNPACVGPVGIGRNFDTGSLSGDPATTPGLFLGLTNLGELATDGIDVVLNYAGDFGPVGFAWSFNGNWTNSSTFNANASSPDSVNRECVGFYSVNCGSIQPEYQFSNRVTFSWDRMDLSLLWRYISSVEQEPLDADPDIGSGPAFSGTITQGNFAGTEVNFREIPSYNYFDLSLRFNVTDNMSLTALVANLTDKDPPLVGNTIGSTSFNSGNTYPSTYDALGRRYSITARLRF